MEPNDLQRPKDSNKYLYRDDIYTANANLFIANNNNPFLVSPYVPPANLAKQSAVNSISSIVNSLIQNLSSVIDLTTFTLSISTIHPIPSGDTLTISSQILDVNATTTLNMTAPDVFVSGGNFTVESLAYFSQPSYFNSISTGQFTASNAVISSFNASSFVTNFQTVNSTLQASTITTTNFEFVTATGSTLTTNSLQVNSTLQVSTINTTALSFQTMFGSTISTNTAIINALEVSSITTSQQVNTLELVFSSMFMKPDTFSSVTGYSTIGGGVYSSILINMNGLLWKIPVEKV